MSDIKANENQTCPAVGYQSLSVCVPVTVTPFARTDATITKCCGDAIITPGDTVCEGTKNGKCTFAVTQVLCVEVPVEFGAASQTGDTYVNCLGVSADDCQGCDESPEAGAEA